MATAVLYKSETIYFVDFFFFTYDGPVFEISFCPFPEEFPADSHDRLQHAMTLGVGAWSKY